MPSVSDQNSGPLIPGPRWLQKSLVNDPPASPEPVAAAPMREATKRILADRSWVLQRNEHLGRQGLRHVSEEAHFASQPYATRRCEATQAMSRETASKAPRGRWSIESSDRRGPAGGWPPLSPVLPLCAAALVRLGAPPALREPAGLPISSGAARVRPWSRPSTLLTISGSPASCAKQRRHGATSTASRNAVGMIAGDGSRSSHPSGRPRWHRRGVHDAPAHALQIRIRGARRNSAPG